MTTRPRSGLDIHLDLVAEGGRLRVHDALREAVTSGRLAPGSRLPSSRSLAADLGVARNTVANAYAQLVAEGWLLARRGSSTWVADRVTPVRTAPIDTGSRISTLPYSFQPGWPDVAAFPRTEWANAAREALAAAPSRLLGYTESRGSQDLRAVLAEYLARVRGVRCHAEQIVLCSGFAQILSLLSHLIRDAGGTLALEGLCHWAHSDIAAYAGVPTVRLPLDARGARVEELDNTPATAVMLTPAHQYPTGATLTPWRRSAAVDWARRTGGLIIEDDYDGEFRYSHRPLGAMQPLAPDHIVYCGTTSKSLLPALRLGWAVLPESWLRPFVVAKRRTDHQSGMLEQLTLTKFITGGAYDRHIRRSRLAYRRRRDQLVAVLAARAPHVAVRGFASGLHAVLRYPADPGRPSEQQLVTAAARRGLAIVGLSDYGHLADDSAISVVVGYATPPDHDYTRALTILADVLSSRLPADA